MITWLPPSSHTRSWALGTMGRVGFAVAALAVLAVAVPGSDAASSAVPSSMAPVTKPTTSSNGISACVQFGDWYVPLTYPSTQQSGGNVKTETQYSPVKPGASHSVPDITNPAASSSYVESLAGGAGSQAYAANPYSGSTTPVPGPTTVTFATKTPGSTKAADAAPSDTANAAVPMRPHFAMAALILALVLVGGTVVL